METYELEEEVYQGLINDAELMAILPNGSQSIYHLQSPSVNSVKYPVLVYSPISDVPSLSADNVEYAHRVTIRIHVITLSSGNNADYEKFTESCRLVKKIMAELNFVRVQTNLFVDNGKKMMIFDFAKGVKS